MNAPALPVDELFQLAPISLWLEDFSGIKRLFEQWRTEGIEDIRAHFALNPEAVQACSAAIRVLMVNERTLQLFGAHDMAQLVDNIAHVFRDDMHAQHAQDMAELWDGKMTFSCQTVNYTLEGRRIDVLLRARILPGHQHDWSRVVIALEDITDRVQTQARLAHSERFANGLFEHSPVSLWLEDFSTIRQLIDEVRAAGIEDFRTFLDVHPEFVERCMQEIRVLQVNQQTLRMFGARDKDELFANINRVFRDDMHEHFAEQLVDLWNNKIFQTRETVNYALNDQVVHVHLQFSVLPGHEDTWGLVLVSLTDITARKKAEAYLEFLGRHDALTKLKNRAYYDEELARLSRKGRFPVSVIVADLNGLKAANDTLGHSYGDDLLRRAGEALRKAVSEPTCVARIGGDEFAVLLPGTDEDGITPIVERIRAVVDMNNQFYTGPRLSFAIGTATAVQPGELTRAIQRADELMYVAKRAFYQQLQNDRRTGTDEAVPFPGTIRS
ncbi:MAG: sensor domain-containing diguanylate cyclase [Rhodocyclaceae bacterium]